MSGRDGESDNGSSPAECGSDIVVPGTQVQLFMATLKAYSESCETSRLSVDNKCAEVNDSINDVRAALNGCRDMKEETRSMMDNTKAMKKTMDNQLRRGKEQLETLEVESAVIQKIAKKATAQCRECRESQERVASREAFICDYVGIVRESETLTRQQYTRTIYAATLAKEIVKLSLKAVESAVSLIENRAVTQSVTDRAPGDDMVDNSQAMGSGSIEILEKVRFLQNDVNDLERISKLLEDVSFLDETLRVANNEYPGLQTDLSSVNDARKHVLKCVRKVMPYDSEKYRSLAHYEREVVVETDRRLKATNRSGSQLLQGAMQTLRTTNVDSPGELPVEYATVITEEDPMDKDGGPSS